MNIWPRDKSIPLRPQASRGITTGLGAKFHFCFLCFQVALRIRPLRQEERGRGAQTVVEKIDDKVSEKILPNVPNYFSRYFLFFHFFNPLISNSTSGILVGGAFNSFFIQLIRDGNILT